MRLIAAPLALALQLVTAHLSAQATAVVPIEMTGHHAFVDVEIGGQVLSFAFDSGAGGVVVNESVARRLGLEATGSGSAIGTSSAVRLPIVHGLGLRLGALRLENVHAVLVDLRHLEKMAGRPIDGIIGRDVLRGRVVLLDHDRRVLEVHERDGFPFEDWGVPCRVSISGPLQVEASVQTLDGTSIHGRFHIDSGAGAFVVLNSRFVAGHGLVDKVGETYPRKARGLTGATTDNLVGRLAAVIWCGLSFPAPVADSVRPTLPVELSGARAGVLASPGLAGLIGNAVLARTNIVFDLGRGRMYLKPNSHWRDAVRSDASGLQLVRTIDGSIRVEGVVERSPAAEAGLSPGDHLHSIDGLAVEAITLAALRKLLEQPDRTFDVEWFRDGEMSRAVLQSRVLNSAVAIAAPALAR